jgi:ribonuclease-3
MTDEHQKRQPSEPAQHAGESMPPPLAALERAVEHRFADPALLLEAVTHRSYVHEHAGPGVISNERLEFLGDAVLALLSAHLLFEQFLESPEGELTAMRAALVRASTLAELARQLDLGPALRLGKGEEVTGGRGRDLLLASALEAVIGAVYRDGGLEAARQFVTPRLQAYARERHLRQYRDDKSLLQEAVQARLGITPTYRVVAREGPSHDPRFVVEVLVGEHALARGAGRSKRQAEQDAAKAALEDPGWQVESAAPDEAEDDPARRAHIPADTSSSTPPETGQS